MKALATRRLLIRDWREDDRELFHRINSDEQVMEFFPFRRDRAQSDAFFDRLRDQVAADAIGFAAVENRETGACMGFCGLHRTDFEPFATQGAIEIGWRLAPEHWGKGYASEAAAALIRNGFEALGFDEIISFAVWSNRRSTAVMERIGMRRDAARDFDHPGVPDTHPELKRHHFYAIRRSDAAKPG